MRLLKKQNKRFLKMKVEAPGFIKCEKGSATVETLPLLLIFIALMTYTLGTFGIIHTGILNSIAARTYAFETFRNRSDLTYNRDNIVPATQFRSIGTRVHAINSEITDGSNNFYATERPIRVGAAGLQTLNRDANYHDEKIQVIQVGKRNTQVEVGPVWVGIEYGICLNSKCGDH